MSLFSKTIFGILVGGSVILLSKGLEQKKKKELEKSEIDLEVALTRIRLEEEKKKNEAEKLETDTEVQEETSSEEGAEDDAAATGSEGN